MRLRAYLDAVVAVLALAVLACLPILAGGCAAAHARGVPATTAEVQGARNYEVPHHNSGADSDLATPPAKGLSYVIPPQSMPSRQEELWVIQRRPDLDAARDGQAPGSGSLVVPRGDSFVPVPLKHTNVKANVAGYVATVDVTQQFQNPYDGKI
jgi:hypothetical protein